MNRISTLLLVLLLPVLVLAQSNAPAQTAAGQQPPTPTASASGQLQPGSLIYAELSKSIDSKKAKAGDPVFAKITQAVLSRGKVVIPKNTKVVGHLTAAKAHTKEQQQSELGIAFDRAELKDGTQVPLTSVTIQALGSAVSLDQPPSNVAGGAGGSEPPTGMPSSRSGGNMGGMNSPMGGSQGGSQYPSSAGTTAGTDMGQGPSSGSVRLNAGSRGVFGLSGIKLEPQAQGGVVAADGKNVKLDGGTQLVLRSQ